MLQDPEQLNRGGVVEFRRSLQKRNRGGRLLLKSLGVLRALGVRGGTETETRTKKQRERERERERER